MADKVLARDYFPSCQDYIQSVSVLKLTDA